MGAFFASRHSTLALAIMLVLAAPIYWFLVRSPQSSAEAALQAFYRGEDGWECQIADPLRRHGATVVPLVTRDLPDKKMPRRRYAIHFLGEGQYAEALPALERIANDVTERNYFRADALTALSQIAPTRAQELAPQVLASQVHDQHGHLRRIVRAIERNDAQITRRECP